MGIEIRYVDPDGREVVLPDARSKKVSPVYCDLGTVSFSYPVVGRNFSEIAELDEFEVSIYIDGLRYGNLSARMKVVSGDDVAEAQVRDYEGDTLASILQEGRVWPAGWPTYDPKNPNFTFTGATAGTVMNAVLSASKARGAMADLTWSFTNTQDSNGVPWTKQISIEAKPGSDMLDVLKSLHGNYMCEFEMEGRELKLYEYETMGVDRTEQAEPLTFRRGKHLIDSPRRSTVRDIATAMLGAGKEDTGVYIERSDPDAIAARRRIEGYVSNGNITDLGTLSAYTENQLAQVVNGKMEKTHGLNLADPTTPRPLRSFGVGDWALSDVGRGQERYRIKQWSMSEAEDGTMSGTVVLNDLLAEATERLVRRVNGILGGSTITGESVASPVDPEVYDGIPPKAPAGLGATSDPYSDNGQIYAQVTATWAQVVANIDNTVCEDLDYYQVRWSGNPTEAPDPVTKGSVSNDQYRLLIANGWTGTRPLPFSKTLAAIELLERLASGLDVYEDFSFRGMSANMDAWNDTLANEFYAANPGTNWPSPGKDRAKRWLTDYIDTNYPLPDIIYHPLYKQQSWRYVKGTDATTVSWSPMAPGIPIYIQVQAVDKAGNSGPWSTQIGILTGVDTTPPAQPSQPVVDNYLGLLRATWDGLSAAGIPLAEDTERVEVHVSTINNFTPTDATRFDTLIRKGSSLYNAPYGVTHYVRFVAVDRQGNRSVPSAVGYGSTGQVVSADVFDGAIGSAKLADLAVITAKINDLAVNNAKIGSMEVGKLTAGTLSAVIVLGERITTALTGQRTEQNPLGFYGWDASENLTLRLDGIDNVITGTLNTAVSGRRVIVGNQTSTTGRVAFVAPDGRYGRIKGFTEGTGLEAMRLEIFDGTAFGSYINMNTEHYTSQRSTKEEHQIRDFFRVMVNGGGDTWAATTQRFLVATDRTVLNSVPNVGVIDIPMAYGGGSLSPLLRFNNTAGYQVALRGSADSSSQNIDVVNGDGTVWYSVRASQFLVQSDGEAKSEPAPVRTAEALASVLAMPVRRYRRRNAGEHGDDLQDREEVGFITQELPEQVVLSGGGTQFVNLYEVVARLAGAVQALNRQIQEMKA